MEWGFSTDRVIVVLLLSVGVPERTPEVELKSNQEGPPDMESFTPCSVRKEKLPNCPTAQRERVGECIRGI